MAQTAGGIPPQTEKDSILFESKLSTAPLRESTTWIFVLVVACIVLPNARWLNAIYSIKGVQHAISEQLRFSFSSLGLHNADPGKNSLSKLRQSAPDGFDRIQLSDHCTERSKLDGVEVVQRTCKRPSCWSSVCRCWLEFLFAQRPNLPTQQRNDSSCRRRGTWSRWMVSSPILALIARSRLSLAPIEDGLLLSSSTSG